MRNLIIIAAMLTGMFTGAVSWNNVSLNNAAFAAGAPKGGDGNVSYKKTTEYSFDDDTIEGDLTKPDGEYVEARKKVKHSNLIKIREEFKDKVMQSVGEL